MTRLSVCVLLVGVASLSGTLAGQEPKKDEPKAKQDIKKDEPSAKVKGILPMNWGKIGLTDDQKQQIYRIQGKYNDEIDKLDAKIKELKATRDKEMKAVLTDDQKKRLEAILLGKDR
jgi:Spy/CpxP family protein refolding chaperone